MITKYNYAKNEWEKFYSEGDIAKIKEILEHYATSTIGEKQVNGTYMYKIVGNYGDMVNGSFGCYNNPLTPVNAYYDPRPAQEGLKILEDVPNNNQQSNS